MRKYLYMLLFVCFCGCSSFNRHRDILDRAESMIERNHADSACQLLAPIYLDDLRGAELRARFALLYSQALDKNYIDLTRDSLAQVAVDYYATKGTPEQKAMAYYYLGRIYENVGDTEECIINYTLATEYVPEESYYLKGLIYYSFGYLYFNQLQYENAIDMQTTAIEAFSQCEANTNEAITAYQISINYRLLKQYIKAEEYIHRALDISLANEDYQTALTYFKANEIIKVEQGKSPKGALVQLYVNYNKYNHGIVPASDFYYLSNLYCEVNNMDSAMLYLRKYEQSIKTPTTENRLAIITRLRKIAEKQNNYKLAHEYAQVEILYSDTINIMRGQHLIETVTEKYQSQLYQSQLKETKLRSKSLRNVFLLMLIISMSLSYIIYIRYKQRVEKMNQDINLANDLIDSLTTSQSILTQQYETIKDSSNPKDVEMIGAVMGRFNNLIEKIPEYEKHPRKFINEFISLVHCSKISETNTFICGVVNNQYGGAIDRLKEQYDLSQSEVETLCMISIGFSNNAMTIAFNHTTYRTIYNYKSNLKSKLGIAINKDSVSQLLKSI